uniref:Uncharacterized protein n=1 Tax=Cannabis sativa TaxID=3483 RepID=A0A803PMI8_CANSA
MAAIRDKCSLGFRFKTGKGFASETPERQIELKLVVLEDNRIDQGYTPDAEIAEKPRRVSEDDSFGGCRPLRKKTPVHFSDKKWNSRAVRKKHRNIANGSDDEDFDKKRLVAKSSRKTEEYDSDDSDSNKELESSKKEASKICRGRDKEDKKYKKHKGKVHTRRRTERHDSEDESESAGKKKAMNDRKERREMNQHTSHRRHEDSFDVKDRNGGLMEMEKGNRRHDDSESDGTGWIQTLNDEVADEPRRRISLRRMKQHVGRTDQEFEQRGAEACEEG